jgi:hypothetical protein
MPTLAAEFANDIRALIAQHQRPGCVTQIDARTDLQVTPPHPESAARRGAFWMANSSI